MRDMPLSRIFLLLSLALYVACLPFDTFCVPTGCDNWPSWATLLFGWLMTDAGSANSTWFANPLLFVGWLGMLKPFRRYNPGKIIAALAGYAALALTVSFYFAETVVSNEGGIAQPITGYGLGYWLWVASAAAFAIAATLNFFIRSAPAMKS